MKTTLKEKVLQFVEQRGSARFTDIQRFIVDHKFGQGTYDNAKRVEKVYVYGEYVDRLVNPYRGYHSCSFWNGGRWSRTGYFLTGPDYLVKGEDGRYSVVRTTKRKVEPAPSIADKIEPVVPKEVPSPEMINLYTVNETTGKVEVIQRPKFDRSWMTNPLIFDEYLTAVMYAEPIQEEYAAKVLAEDEMDIVQEEAEQAIAEEMIQEFEAEKDLNLHDVIKSLLPVKAGQEIFIIEKEEGYIARMYKTTVTEVILYVTENETTYEVLTSDDESFGDKDLGKEFFTDKQSCLVALNELF